MPKRIDSLYLHFPFCSHLCNYCDFYKKIPTKPSEDFKLYQATLTESFQLHQKLINQYGYSWSELKTLYIGGGTPSLWGAEGARFLGEFFESHQLALDQNCEFTLEVNPGAWTEESLQSFQSIGVNRYSLGIQALDSEMIKYLDRVHGLDDVYQTLEYFNKNSFNFSVDFMLGLPFSKENNRNVIKELEVAMSFNPSHFSIYILTVKDNYKFFRDLPTEDWIENEYMLVSEYLKKNGFVHYEVSNFAKPGRQSRHNLNYWKSRTVASLGPSATGFLAEELIRYKWKTNSIDFDKEILSEKEFHLEKIYMALRSEEGLSLADFGDEFKTLAISWQQRQLATLNSNRVCLTSKGYLLLDSLMNDLFVLKLV